MQMTNPRFEKNMRSIRVVLKINNLYENKHLIYNILQFLQKCTCMTFLFKCNTVWHTDYFTIRYAGDTPNINSRLYVHPLRNSTPPIEINSLWRVIPDFVCRRTLETIVRTPTRLRIQLGSEWYEPGKNGAVRIEHVFHGFRLLSVV